ncbi:MAG: endonuclease/exonuclease/phosphatase family protein [Deltaproteobacteria bacterium]|nr:endonuclease/exonuclease/phosphatase family protein [Deltaproteobacteria bacterium]
MDSTDPVPPHPPSLRVATWNVHGAVGIDLRRSIDRVADVLRALEVDIALLQELDVGRSRSAREDQPSALALRLGHTHVFGAAIEEGEASYGNAIVSRLPITDASTHVLPASPGAEPRAMTRGVIHGPLGSIELVVTHLGLLALDRLRQVEAILERLGPPTRPRIVGGDLNDGPTSRTLTRLLGDTLLRAETRATFPAIAPFLRLDHVLVDRRLAVRRVARPSLREIRAASDHLPAIVEITTRPERSESARSSEVR